jgi:hypothetical protein
MNTGSIETISKYLSAKSSPVVSLFILIIAIGSINAWQLILPNISNDNSFSIAAAKNIYDGKGYTLATVSEQDLSVTNYEPLNKWPPGYSWLLALVKKITNTDWIISCYILNAIGATLLVLALRKIMLLLQIPVRIVNIYLLFAGFVPYPFLSTWFSDLLAAAFFMWGIALLLHMVVKNKNLFIYAIASGLFLGFCAWLKYLYLSVSPVPFIFLLFYAFRTRNMKLAKALACGGIFLLASLGYMLWFQQHHSGNAFYINPTGRGFFPKNVLHIGPIVPGSLLDFKLYDMQLSTILHIPYLKILVFWKWLNIFLLLGILFLVIRFHRETGFPFEKPLNIYMGLALAVSVSICLFLALLSLTQGPYFNRFVVYWTYVEELRYYAVVLIFIPQGILFLLLYRSDLLSRAKKPVIAIILIIVIIQVSHGFYYLTKQVFFKEEVGKNRESEQLYFLTLKTVGRLLKYNKKLIICSDSHDIANISSLSGIPVIYDYYSLNGELRSSKPVTLLVVLSEPVLPDLKHFFSIYNPKLIYIYKDTMSGFRSTHFYIVKIP